MLRHALAAVVAVTLAVSPARAFQFEFDGIDPEEEAHNVCRLFLELETVSLANHTGILLKELWDKPELRDELQKLSGMSTAEKFDKLLELARKAKVDEIKIVPFELSLSGWRSHVTECPSDGPPKPKFDS